MATAILLKNTNQEHAKKKVKAHFGTIRLIIVGGEKCFGRLRNIGVTGLTECRLNLNIF